MEEAVLAPKMHSQWLPDEVYLEKNKFDQSVILQLEKMGTSSRKSMHLES
jgi:gamma-glutamyltranspeptidase/glutathione hydrolase